MSKPSPSCLQEPKKCPFVITTTMSNANKQQSRIFKFNASANTDTDSTNDCTKQTSWSGNVWYDCSCGGCSSSFNHQGFCTSDTFYMWAEDTTYCSNTTLFQLNCTNCLFLRNSDTSGESVSDMALKYMGWYWAFASPSGLSISTTKPTTINFVQTLQLSIACAQIKVDTGSTGLGCYKTPEQNPNCTSSCGTAIYPSGPYADYECSACNYQASN
jgi:hypothetical protein